MMTTAASDKGANNVILYLLQENAKCSTTCFMIELLGFFFIQRNLNSDVTKSGPEMLLKDDLSTFKHINYAIMGYN